MSRFLLLLLFLLTHGVLFSQSITLEDIVNGKYRANGVDIPVSSSDGNFFYRPNADNTKIIKFSYHSGLPVDTIVDLSCVSNSSPLQYFEGFIVDPTEQQVVLYNNVENIYRRSFIADIYLYDIKKSKLDKLVQSHTKQRIPLFSSDGSMLAYVMTNNIYIYHFDTDVTDQVTTDGSANFIINGATDWVYEEEFSTTSIMSFSPDNNYLAFLRFDESAVKKFSFQEFRQQTYPSSKIFKYPKAGEKNSFVTPFIYNIQSKQSQALDLQTKDLEYIPNLLFVSNSQLALITLNRNQNHFRLYMVDVRMNNEVELLYEEYNDRYLNYDFLASIRFLDNSFFYISEKDGYSHIYLHSIIDKKSKQLTSGNYDVTSLLAIDTVAHTIYYQAAYDSSLERSIHRLNYRNNKQKKISNHRGVNTASFSNNGKYFINNLSNISTPNIITVCDSDGREIRILEDNASLKYTIDLPNFPQKEFMTLLATDGTSLNAWMIKPADFSQEKTYPLLMVQYSGPDSQQVLNQFDVDWFYYLATQGYIVACVDGRGTGARGQEFRKCTYLNLGIKESDDQIFAANYFGQLPFIDAQNISIWGWSYGGYNVLMSLSRSKGVFKKGVAIAPITDWRFYDSVYTERYMRTPHENKQGYDNGSPIKLASDLSGKLLLIHGSADDNVHYQNTMNYVSSLILNNKHFELFIFPDLNHSLQGVNNRQYLYHKIINFLEE